MKRKNAALQVAHSAILSALALILIYLSSLIPMGRLGIVAAAGLLPAAAVIAFDWKAGILSWAVVSVLAFLLVPDKFCVLLFAVLFGVYPVVKSLSENRKHQWQAYLLKLAFFNAALTVIYQVMEGALLANLSEILGQAWWLVYLAGNIVFLIYDYGFSRLIGLYIARIQRTVS